MIAAVALPLPLQAQLREESLRSCPRECCGLLEGTIDRSVANVAALHPMPNLADEADRFEIDPASHIRLLRDLRGTGRNIVGCYHSHPNGRAEPSVRDRESATEEGFVWLICGVTKSGETDGIAGFVSGSHGFEPVEIMRETGTAGLGPTAGEGARGPGKASLDRFAAPLL